MESSASSPRVAPLKPVKSNIKHKRPKKIIISMKIARTMKTLTYLSGPKKLIRLGQAMRYRLTSIKPTLPSHLLKMTIIAKMKNYRLT